MTMSEIITTQVAKLPPRRESTRTITVRFDSNVDETRARFWANPAVSKTRGKYGVDRNRPRQGGEDDDG